MNEMSATIIAGIPIAVKIPVFEVTAQFGIVCTEVGFVERDIANLLIELTHLIITYGIGQLGTILDDKGIFSRTVASSTGGSRRAIPHLSDGDVDKHLTTALERFRIQVGTSVKLHFGGHRYQARAVGLGFSRGLVDVEAVGIGHLRVVKDGDSESVVILPRVIDSTYRQCRYKVIEAVAVTDVNRHGG